MQTKRLTIFEGCDGSGKTTAARAFAQRTGATYVHFGPLFNVTTGVARMYVEAMLPALLGYQDVVWDRSWLSETPYGNAFRNGQDRMGPVGRRMLERLAMRCGAKVVRCDPGWGKVKESYETGREEMLTNTDQLGQVYRAYQDLRTDLPMIDFDYRVDRPLSMIDIRSLLPSRVQMRHPLNVRSAGSLAAKVLLVGEAFGERKNDDAWYQWPFASFSKQGCSWWLTERLMEADISESDLLWVNANEPNLENFLTFFANDKRIVALGQNASKALAKIGRAAYYQVSHPSHARRFKWDQEYELIPYLKETLYA